MFLSTTIFQKHAILTTGWHNFRTLEAKKEKSECSNDSDSSVSDSTLCSNPSVQFLRLTTATHNALFCVSAEK